MKDEENKALERMESARKEALARAVTADFLKRQEERRALERSWQVNIRFLSGDQYCGVLQSGEVGSEEAIFDWQQRGVFNHIAPTVDARLARLSKCAPPLSVRAFSDSPEDMKTARLCSNILKAVKGRSTSTASSRVRRFGRKCAAPPFTRSCGTAAGDGAGREGAVCEGDVSVAAIPPFEVYPDSLSAESLEEVASLIHARGDARQRNFRTLRRGTCGAHGGALCIPPSSGESGRMEDAEIVIERYTRPDRAHPLGGLEIAAGGVLLYEGPLPYENGERGARTFPFVRQTCTELPGSFFGRSIIDRMIPLQRAYNAVRNRKHEF